MEVLCQSLLLEMPLIHLMMCSLFLDFPQIFFFFFGKLVDNNCAVNFSSDGCVVQDKVTGKSIAKGPKWGTCIHYFYMFQHFLQFLLLSLLLVRMLIDLSMVWHRRLGHPNTQILSYVWNFDFLGHRERSSLSLKCDSCKLGKSKTLQFPLHASRASHYFDLIHSDIWGPSPISSHEKFKYYVTFINDIADSLGLFSSL